MSKTLFRTLGWIVIIMVAIAGWHYLLVSTRPPALRAWESCKTTSLQNWASSHGDQAERLLHFAKDHFYSFGGESGADHFDDHDSRGTAVADAGKLGISETELVQLDQHIANQCGPFPRQK
jgi:hypothetical protein